MLLTLREVLERYDQLVQELKDLYLSEGRLMSARTTAYYQAMDNSEESSVTGRVRDAEAAAAPFDSHIVTVQADIKCLQAELRYLDNVIGAYRSGVLT